MNYSVQNVINQVEQYGRRNNTVISGIPDDISDNDLESTVSGIMLTLILIVGI